MPALHARRNKGWEMIDLTEDERMQLSSLWVGVIAFAGILYLTGSFWKAILLGIFVLGSCLLGFGRSWVMRGSFVIAIVAIAVALAAPGPERWVQLFQDGRQ